MKPKLLFLAPQIPYPPTDGGKIGIYYPAKYLINYFDVFLITPVKKISNKVEESIKHFDSLGVKYIPIVKDTSDKILDLIKNIFNEIPFKWYKYYTDEIYIECKKIINENKIDFIFTSAPHMALYSLKLKKEYPNLKIFLREHNIEFSLVEQFVNFTKNPIYKLIGVWQLKKTKKMEQKYWELFDKVFFISDYDYNIAKKLRPDLIDKLEILYDGFEVRDICIKSNYLNSFIIPSNVKTPQNQVNLRWFIDKIWIPSIDYLKKNNFYLYITGGSKEEWEAVLRISNIQSLNINLLGFVENIDEEICKHKYVISSTVFGSGVRLKMLHSMSLGKVVFATGYDVSTAKVFKDLENIVKFDTKEEFIEKIKLLEENSDLYSAISENAFITIKNYFSWNKYAETLFKIAKGEN